MIFSTPIYSIMKQVVIVFLFSFLFASCSKEDKAVLDRLDKIEQTINNSSAKEPIYKLYPTRNMWNLLKLDTRNGKISIVQFSVEDINKQFEYSLSDVAIVANETPGRFVLQPTENLYNFIMLDQITGQTYQVQWSFDADKRVVIPINKY